MKEKLLELARQMLNQMVSEYLKQFHGKEWEAISHVLFSFEDWMFEELEKSNQD